MCVSSRKFSRQRDFHKTTKGKKIGSVYGLNEASRYWYNRVHEELLNIGMTKSKYDDALFFYKPDKNEKCEGVIVIHVDDFLYNGGSSIFE